MAIEKTLKFIWNEFIYGGHLISLGAVSIVFTSAILLNIKITWDCLIIIYLFAYNSILYNRYKERRTDYLTNPERTKNLEKYFPYIFLIVFFSILISVGILFYYNRITALLFLILLSLLGFLYTEYFKKITEKIIAFKNIYFSLITSLLLIFLAFYYSYPLLTFPIFLILIFVFLRMLINTIFLDIKDIESDKKIKLMTFPILYGSKKILVFLKGITILSVLPIILGFYFDLIPKFSLVLLFVIPYSFYYFNKSKLEKNFYLVNYVLADFEFILWSFFVLAGKISL
ncbi:hypothetical protein AMJ49_06935 [Parcubacteria bacterium DG_74_2]|nr:MAG: hypothetical protein AMJ49_06935 [Parcubacteria bacterium DG_74_2]